MFKFLSNLLGGRISLHQAAETGDVTAVKAWIAGGSDVNAKENYSGTPLHFAACCGRTETALALINAGADVHAKTNGGGTPLHLAAWKGQTEAASALVNAGAAINAKDDDDWTPLHLATEWGQTQTALALVNAGADVNAKSNYGETPLLLAAMFGQTEAASALINAGADVNAKTNGGLTPLYYATYYGHTKIALALINAGVDVHAKDKYGETPLHLAAEWGQTQTALALIKAGADIGAKDNDGWTPLHLAAERGKIEMMLALIKAGADVNAKTNNGWTPLHLAAWKGQTEAALALIKAGAAINAKDNDDWTPWHFANNGGHAETANVLVKATAEREKAVRAAIERGEEDRRHRILEIERAALHFAIATPDSEFRHGGEIEAVFADRSAPQKIKAHARVFPSTISRIDADFEAARICYAAHGFYCVAENYGKRVRLFRGIAGESVVHDFLIFAGNPQQLRQIYAKAFFAYYGVKPTIDIVKRRKIARGELPKGAEDCPIYHFPGREGAKPGYVYVASSPLGYPPINGEGLYKIGMTEDTIDKRMRGLNNTSVLHPFEPNLALATQDAKEAEKKIHLALDRWRVSKNREFFRISAKELEFQLKRLVGINIKLY